MKAIKTIDDLEKLLSFEKAIVFVFLEWSGQAHFSKRIVSEWEDRTKLRIPLFEMNPEDSDEFSKWVYENNIHGQGYGALVWLNKGEVINFEQNAGDLGILEIERKTSKVFL